MSKRWWYLCYFVIKFCFAPIRIFIITHTNRFPGLVRTVKLCCLGNWSHIQYWLKEDICIFSISTTQKKKKFKKTNQTISSLTNDKTWCALKTPPLLEQTYCDKFRAFLSIPVLCTLLSLPSYMIQIRYHRLLSVWPSIHLGDHLFLPLNEKTILFYIKCKTK